MNHSKWIFNEISATICAYSVNPAYYLVLRYRYTGTDSLVFHKFEKKIFEKILPNIFFEVKFQINWKIYAEYFVKITVKTTIVG